MTGPVLLTELRSLYGRITRCVDAYEVGDQTELGALRRHDGGMQLLAFAGEKPFHRCGGVLSGSLHVLNRRSQHVLERAG